MFQYVYTILQNTGLSLAIYYSNDISFAGANYSIVNNDSNTINVIFTNYLTDKEQTVSVSSSGSAFIPYVVVPTLRITGASNINNVVITKSGETPQYRLLEHLFPDVENLYKPGEFFNDAKTQLTNILKTINARIFQSRNRWFIINNSSYGNQTIKNASSNTAAGGNVPTGIRASETSSLENNGVENCQFATFSEAGVFSGLVSTNVLYRVPTDLHNIGADLIKRQSKPVKNVNLKMNTQNENRLIFSPNNSFEYTTLGDPTFGYTLTNDLTTTTTMGTNPIVKTGNQSVKSTGFIFQSTPGSSKYFENNINLIQAVSNSVMPNTMKFCYYIDVPDDMVIDAEVPNQGNLVFGNTFKAKLFYQFRFSIGSDVYYYRESDNTYQKNSLINNPIVLFRKDLNKWLIHEVSNLPIDDAVESSNANNNITMVLQVSQLCTNIEDGTNGGFNGIYFDDVYFAFQASSANNIIYNREVSDTFTGKRDIGFDYIGHNVSAAYYRPRDNNESFYKQLNEITSQQVLNDNRSKVTEFEGTFRNKITNGNPLGFESKIFVDFTTQPAGFAPVSGIIDQLEYRMKSNRYKVKFRLPNQDDDKTNTLTIKED